MRKNPVARITPDVSQKILLNRYMQIEKNAVVVAITMVGVE
jgi:hypothetical protein